MLSLAAGCARVSAVLVGRRDGGARLAWSCTGALFGNGTPRLAAGRGRGRSRYPGRLQTSGPLGGPVEQWANLRPRPRHLVVDLGAGLDELDGLGVRPRRASRFRRCPGRRRKSRTSWVIFIEQKCGPHRAEVGDLGGLLGQGLVVEALGLVRVEAEVELVVPAELEARLAQRVVADLRARVALGQVGGVAASL